MTRTGLLALAGVLIASPLQAQHDHGTSEAAAEHKCEMHASAGHAADPEHAFMPKMVLKHAAGLGLTEQQVKRLEDIQAAHKKDCETRKAEVKAAEDAAAAVLAAGSPDHRAYEAKLLEAAAIKVKCKVAMVMVARQGKAVLSAEQAAHLSHMSHAGH